VLAAAQDQRVAALCLLDPVDNTGMTELSEELRVWTLSSCISYSRTSIVCERSIYGNKKPGTDIEVQVRQHDSAAGARNA
jgi:hypothetical protein